MRGYSHALSGAVTGTAAGQVLHLPITGTLALAGLGAGFATIPDLDTAHSCASRSLGFLSATFALAVAKVSGGHRHGSHSLVGVAVFTALAWLACHYRHDPAGRWALALFLALALAAGLRALRIGGHFADLAAIAGAGFIAWTGWELALVPLACALGCLTHLAGDSLTVQGVPLAWPVTMRHFGLPRPLSFTTGTWRETWVITPALFGALGLLAFTAIH